MMRAKKGHKPGSVGGSCLCGILSLVLLVSCGDPPPPPAPREKAEVVRRTIIFSEDMAEAEKKPAVSEGVKEGLVSDEKNQSGQKPPEEMSSVRDQAVSVASPEAVVSAEPGPASGVGTEAEKKQAEETSVKAKVPDAEKKEVLKQEAGGHATIHGLIREEDIRDEKMTLSLVADARVYNPEGRIDPFRPLIQERPQVKREDDKRLERRVPQTPLEKVDLSQLRLVGIVRSPMGARAMVEESSGRGYVVSMGTYMGLHSGKVTAIEGDRVVVTEIVEDLSGSVREERRELKLQKPTGE